MPFFPFKYEDDQWKETLKICHWQSYKWRCKIPFLEISYIILDHAREVFYLWEGRVVRARGLAALPSCGGLFPKSKWYQTEEAAEHERSPVSLHSSQPNSKLYFFKNFACFWNDVAISWVILIGEDADNSELYYIRQNFLFLHSFPRGEPTVNNCLYPCNS